MIWMREKRKKLFMCMELEACWNETERLFKCHDCIVNNIPEEYCPPMPLPVPPDYANNLIEEGRVATIAVVDVDDIFAVGLKNRCYLFGDELNRMVPVNNLDELR